MGVPREQFDETLGGTETLPSAVSIIKFANARSEEIAALTEAIETLPSAVSIIKFANARSEEIAALTEAIEDPRNSHLAFQRLPKHLRRRAMSHNYKRMPKRLRDVHFAQMEKSGLPTRTKRPSRRYRRRPRELLAEYNRRARAAVWLETHIWHAKRFHMISHWGYKLAHHPTEKSFRACYRATTRHCLLQDISYLNCIELEGRESDILKGIQEFVSAECGLTFAAKGTLSGSREGSVMVFKRGTYPSGAIGRVSFMWRPDTEGINGIRTLWVWCHPAFYGEFLQELISVFNFIPEKTVEMEVEAEDISKLKNDLKSKNVEKSKLETKNIGKIPRYTGNGVVMNELKDTLNRFRLTGPLAQVVLTEALKFVCIDNFISQTIKQEKQMDVDDCDPPRSDWLRDFYNNESRFNSLKIQKSYWENVLPKVNSAAELPTRVILPATVMDPRLSMPTKRIKAVSNGVVEPQSVAELVAGLSCNSPLWEIGLRDIVSHSKMAAAQLNSLRSRALVPGLASPAWLGLFHVSHLPLLLVQRPGAVPSGYGSGWDVIAPAGWGMPLWLGLVYRGARVGGLRESERLRLETASGPILAPDTQAGRDVSDQRGQETQDKHFRLPPDKRPNFVKLGVVSPFRCPWLRLLQDWHPGEEDRQWYVIRDRGHLEYLTTVLNRTKPFQKCDFNDEWCRGLIQVGVEMCGRGTVTEGAMICALAKKDLRLMKIGGGRGPTEPLHEDKNEEVRKTLRDAHQARLRRLRRKRVKTRRELEDQGIFQSEKSKVSPTEELVKTQADLMKELWLPSEVKGVRNSSTRCIMGFVTCGDYSFTQSRCVGYGYIALSAFLTSRERNQGYVLIRNISSSQYDFARLKLLPIC